jgi:D-beta-D-heptose 7-phosphate kinase / D-beta-D-heptose 1-phosphate adenosyltransferase
MMTNFSNLIDGMAGRCVVVIGDAMLDRFVYGRVHRISPEAPIPVLITEQSRQMLGGAGNVAANLAALGVRTRLIGIIGADSVGTDIISLSEQILGASGGLLRDPERPTTVKTRFIAGGQQLLRADEEKTTPLSLVMADALMHRAEEAIAGADLLILSDYGKGVLTADLCARLIAMAAQRGVRVLVDPKGRDYHPYRGAYAITPNASELALATGLPTQSDEEAMTAARRLMDLVGIAHVVATRSEKGLSVIATDSVVHWRAQAREVFDVSGAGDTVVAVLAASLAAGASLVEGAWLANMAAGIVVGKIGTACVHPEELRRALALFACGAEEDGRRDKLADWEQAAARRRLWQDQGLRVGFTNGCFDLLHPGHISLLAFARARCDRLIVAINSDASVARLKGAARPIVPAADRAAVLSALADVDMAVIFADDTPLPLIRHLRPDVLVKGADYQIKDIVGSGDVLSWGGEVARAPLLAGRSTTALVDRLAQHSGDAAQPKAAPESESDAPGS